MNSVRPNSRKFEISKIYIIMLQRYRDYKIYACGNSFEMAKNEKGV